MEAGTTLQGKYVIDHLLGKGGMGAVYLAHQKALGGKRVAVKQMQVTVSEPSERTNLIAQFQREARLLATLEHPSLVTIYDYFEEGDNHFLVMSFVDGRTLEQTFLDCGGQLDISTILSWMDQICDVLMYLHAHDPPIIYRDLKPSNVMLDKKSRIWLLDFGIAKIAEPDSKTATLIKGAGTLGYAPVEQFGHSSTDARSDVYSLGATLYSLLAGTQPPVSVDLMLNDARLVPPSQYNRAVSPELEGVVFRMMAVRKEDRYQSMREARNALANVTKRLGDVEKRKSAREAPGSLKLRPHDTGSSRPMDVAPSGSLVASNSIFDAAPAAKDATFPMPRNGPLPPSAPPKGIPSAMQASTSRAGTLRPSRAIASATVGPPKTAPDAPRWVQYLEETTSDPDILNLKVPWYRRPHAIWYVYIGLTALGVLFALPTFMGYHSVGVVPGINFAFYSLGAMLTHTVSNRMLHHAGGLIGQLSVPLIVTWYFYSVEDFYPMLMALYVIAQGMADLGMNLGATYRATSGPGFDVYSLLNSSDPQEVLHLGWALKLGGEVGTAVVLFYMVQWLYHYRPRKRIILVP